MRGHNREPIKNTCPNIDKRISELNSIKKDLRNSMDDIDSIINELEDLRASNSELRDWGREEAETVDKLEDENYELRRELENIKIQESV
jgi:DNA repair ATPase RecN